MGYSREIDGLRAIAVLAVVAYHASGAGAGFVGVDVFFAISGYLITALLLREHAEQGGIDLPAFYARRIRRIVPAAALVVVATLAAGTMLLSGAEIERAAKSAAASALFVANFFFQATTGGYFDARSEEMPLLHLWSLSVEEQFYLLWPALLIVLLKGRIPVRPALVVLGLASLLLAEAWLRTDPDAAFYQMPARFWELAAGGLVACGARRGLPGFVGYAGLVLVLGACLLPATHFPGLGAFPAVLGACLVLASVHAGAGNAVLASPPLVGIGKVSYSLYLWHWPLLALYRATSIGDGSLAVRVQLCMAALLLALASYRYVEQPFRRLRLASARTLAGGAALSLALAASALALALRAPAVSAASPLQRAAAAAEHDVLPLACHAWAGDPPSTKCPRAAGSRVGIWGDSMAWSWTPAVLQVDPHAARFTRDACGPFLDYLPEAPLPGDRRCHEFAQLVPGQVHGLQLLVLVARWDLDPGRARGLRRALQAVSPHVGKLVLLGPSPHMRELVPRCILQDRAGACAVPRAAFDAQAAPVRAMLAEAAAGLPNVEILDPADVLCTRTSCPAVSGGVALYWDTHHLTTAAARRLRLDALLPPE